MVLNPGLRSTGYVGKNGTTTLYSYSLTRDNLGRVSQKVETLNGITSTFDYFYDVSGRLTRVDKNSVTVSTYTYDNNSNRTGGVIGGTTTTATYDDQDRMTAYNSNTYTYNRNGELQSKTDTLLSQTTNYTYDTFGQLTSVAMPSSTINYEIDPVNRRWGRKVGSTVQGRYVRDLEGRIVAEMNSSNVMTRRYVYATKSHVPDYFLDMAGDKYRMFTDQLGSVRLVVKLSTGAVMQRMEHDEFGRVVQDTNPGYQPFGFAGGLYDWDTKLVRFGVRDYDPEAGRWTAKDPILFEGRDSNLYGYVANDSINSFDPSGLIGEGVVSFPIGIPAVGINPATIATGIICSVPGDTSPNQKKQMCIQRFEAAKKACDKNFLPNTPEKYECFANAYRSLLKCSGK